MARRPLDVACAFPASALDFYLTQLGPVGRVLGEVDASTRNRVLDRIRPAFDRYLENTQVRFSAACWLVTTEVPNTAD